MFMQLTDKSGLLKKRNNAYLGLSMVSVEKFRRKGDGK